MPAHWTTVPFVDEWWHMLIIYILLINLYVHRRARSHLYVSSFEKNIILCYYHINNTKFQLKITIIEIIKSTITPSVISRRHTHLQVHVKLLPPFVHSPYPFIVFQKLNSFAIRVLLFLYSHYAVLSTELNR